VGAAGGVGGFLLPNVLGLAKQITGSFAPGLGALAFVTLFAAFNVWAASRAWMTATDRLEPAIS